ncbi:MAG: STAS domain-containing protein [Ardenticatenaceae bacterium]|nr:STAS domain-containing protein [Ardenticatenaceae bacterium]
MEIHTRHYNDVVILSVTGRLDSETAPQLLQTIGEQITAGVIRLVCDLNKVTHLTNGGAKALVEAVRLTQKEGGDFRLAHVQVQVKYVLNLTGVDGMIKIYSNVVGATASYFPGPVPGER